jgi:hypothetical protein
VIDKDAKALRITGNPALRLNGIKIRGDIVAHTPQEYR